MKIINKSRSKTKICNKIKNKLQHKSTRESERFRKNTKWIFQHSYRMCEFQEELGATIRISLASYRENFGGSRDIWAD